MTSVLAILTAALSALPAESAVTNCAELTDVLLDRAPLMERFNLTATLVHSPRMNSMSLVDESGATSILFLADVTDGTLRAGDRLELSGTIYRKPGEPTIAEGTSVVVRAHGSPPLAQEATSRELLLRALEFQPVRFVGTVEDVLADEIDPRFALLVLRDEFGPIYGSLHLSETSFAALRKLVGARVEARGLCNPGKLFNRRKLGTSLGIETFEVLDPPPKDPFAVPALNANAHLAPYELALVGRRRATGRVIAAWAPASILLRTSPESVMRVDLAEDRIPSHGDFVDVVGYPETDLYRFNLSRAIWRKTEDRPVAADAEIGPPETAESVTARELLYDVSGHLEIKSAMYGKVIRLVGTVEALPSPDGGERRILLDNGGFTVPVDASALPSAFVGIEARTRLAVTGTCVMDIDNWRPNATLPQIRGFFVVPRTAADIEILSRPPWWTARRLANATGVLLALLAAISVWGLVMRRAVSRKSRELEAEIVARVGADLKVHERTRLAVELHDSLSQTLTGIALEIRSAQRAAATDEPRRHRHLALAAKAIDSCRGELRNCLWDLRNDALDDEDMNNAIRRTLQPHLDKTELTVRFSVPRNRLTDNTAHAILRILRELASNAVRHGHATRIQVAGAIEGDRLLFSVRDNGVGRDPSLWPGLKDGHFGVQGIRERLDACGGEMSVQSAPDTGTKVTLSIRVPQERPTTT